MKRRGGSAHPKYCVKLYEKRKLERASPSSVDTAKKQKTTERVAGGRRMGEREKKGGGQKKKNKLKSRHGTQTFDAPKPLKPQLTSAHPPQGKKQKKKRKSCLHSSLWVLAMIGDVFSLEWALGTRGKIFYYGKTGSRHAGRASSERQEKETCQLKEDGKSQAVLPIERG